MDMIEERTERMKEMLKIMSLNSFAYLAGVLMYAYLVGLILTIVYFGIGSIKEISFSCPGSYKIIIVAILYMVSSTNFALFLSRFFTNPKLGGEFITFTLLGINLLFVIFRSTSSLFK